MPRGCTDRMVLGGKVQGKVLLGERTAPLGFR